MEEKTGKVVLDRSGEIQAFVEYDNKGKPVVLRRNTRHPGGIKEDRAHQELMSNPASQDPNPKSFGNTRFFGDVQHVVADLKAKMSH